MKRMSERERPLEESIVTVNTACAFGILLTLMDTRLRKPNDNNNNIPITLHSIFFFLNRASRTCDHLVASQARYPLDQL